jgi:hypothetical protein
VWELQDGHLRIHATGSAVRLDATEPAAHSE